MADTLDLQLADEDVIATPADVYRSGNSVYTCLWHLRGDEWFFSGHFPGRPTLPGVLMCEAIAQMGAITVLSDQRFAGKLPLFGGLDRARFRRQVVPGDTLELVVELGRMSARAGKGSGRAMLNGEVACECELMFVLVDA